MVNHGIPMRKDEETHGKPSDSEEKDKKTYGKPSDSYEKRWENLW